MTDLEKLKAARDAAQGAYCTARSAVFSLKMLTDARACSEQVDLFRKTFGESVNVTVARACKVADKFDWDFASRFLDDEGKAEYERVRGPALAEYQRVSSPAWAEYQRVHGPAWAFAYIATVTRRKAAGAAA